MCEGIVNGHSATRCLLEKHFSIVWLLSEYIQWQRLISVYYIYILIHFCCCCCKIKRKVMPTNVSDTSDCVLVGALCIHVTCIYGDWCNRNVQQLHWWRLTSKMDTNFGNSSFTMKTKLIWGEYLRRYRTLIELSNVVMTIEWNYLRKFWIFFLVLNICFVIFRSLLVSVPLSRSLVVA